MRLLLAEDDINTVHTIQLCLQLFQPDWQLSVVEDGIDAVNAINAESFHGIILDLGIPSLDGMHVLEDIRPFNKAPIIVVTARHHQEDKVKAFNLGVKDFIFKPFDFKLLLKSMRENFKN
jgi:DNA-binding response OmpR family regulator